MIKTQYGLNNIVQVHMDRLRATVQTLQAIDQYGNPDMEVTQLISRLMLDCTPKVKEAVAAKLDDQAKLIELQKKIIAEQRVQIKDLQDELHYEVSHPLRKTYVVSKPWTSREEN